MADTYHHISIRQQIRTGEFKDNWPWNEPKWWRKAYKHRPRRHDARLIAHSVVRGVDPDATVWPLDVKPWIYYW
jgi:hypothetical protein